MNVSEQEIDRGASSGVASVEGARVLFARGGYESGQLAARSVVILVSGDAH